MATWHALSPQVRELVTVYAAAAVPMGIALVLRRASWRTFLRWPILAAVVMLVGVFLWWFIRAQLIPLATPRPNAWLMYLGGWAFFVCLGFMAGILVTGRLPDAAIKRGTEIQDGTMSAGAARRTQTRAQKRGTLTLAGIELDPLDETKHFKLIGTTGTGKSTAIRELLGAALARGDRAIIADPDAGYLNRFYSEKSGDVILSPFDKRSRRWDPFSEIEQDYDADQLAQALIPETKGQDEAWRDYARTFIASIAKQLRELGERDRDYARIEELHRLVTRAPIEELKILLEHTNAHTFLSDNNERMFGSIRSVASNSIAALEYIAKQEAEAFSIRQWVRGQQVRAGQGSGRALFLPYSATQIAALGSTISAWMRIAIFEAMSGTERDQRLWFIVDELDALGPIDGLKDALARLRKFGGRCVLGFQSIAQVRSTNGEAEAQTIVENCGNTLILRCSASEQGGTARFASRLIGEREIIRPQVTETHRGGFPGESQRSKTYSTQHVTEAAVLPSEIEQLPDLHGFLKLASSPQWRRVQLPVPER